MWTTLLALASLLAAPAFQDETPPPAPDPERVAAALESLETAMKRGEAGERVRAIEDALLDFGADALKDADGHVTLAAFVVVGIYGVVTAVLSRLVYAVEYEENFGAFGLDDDAAEIAARLMPEWSGTVEELVEAAPRLVAEGVAR